MTDSAKDWPGTPLPYTWAALTDVGQVREQNEDAYALEPEAGLFLVSDGMGGHRGGELASQIIAQDLPPAIETKLSELKSKHPRAIRALLKKQVAEQSRQLCMEGNSEDGYVDMGATLALTLFLNGRAFIANLGDSRVYRLRKRRLSQLSKDHSVVAELLDQGQITPIEAQDHEDLGIITHYVGMQERALCHIRSVTLQPGDRFLLCTDGLTDMVPHASLKQNLIKHSDCQDCCQALIKQANDAGGHDNITALIMEWQGTI